MTAQNKTPSAGKLLGASQKTVWRHCIAAVAKDLLPWWLAGAAVAVALAHCSDGAHASQSAKAQSVGCARAKVAAGARNTQPTAACAPAHGRFSCLNCRAGHGACVAGPNDCGQGAAFREGAGTTVGVFRTPCPPYARRKAAGGSQTFPTGGRAMSHRHSRALCAFPLARPGRATVAPVLKGAGAENTISVAEAAPAWEKRGFVTSQSLAGAAASGLHGFGRDGAIRKEPARLRTCFHIPPAYCR